MRLKVVVSLAATVAALSFTLPAHALDPFLWYNGDFDGNTGLYNVLGGALGDGRIYDDFVVPTGQSWTVSGFFIDVTTDMSTFSTVDWEIRSGMSVGNGGTLVASGTGGATLTPGVSPSFGGNRFFTEVGAALTLGPGTYYLNATPIDGTGGSFTYVLTSSGTNAIGTPAGNNGNAFFDNSFTPADYASADFFVGRTADFSYGIRGTSALIAAPEPSALALGILGATSLVGLITRRKIRS